ncbi:MAG: matrixin family metalloprotease [Chitinophagaceae bacterium]|nr:matrixin family metalloprotease [Chitinophagaceae bacterium]
MKSIIFSACLILFVTGIFGQNPKVITKPVSKNIGIVNKDMSSALTVLEPGKYSIRTITNKIAIEADLNLGLQLRNVCTRKSGGCESQTWNIINVPNKSGFYYIQQSNGKYMNLSQSNNNVAELVNVTKLKPQRTEWEIKLKETGKYSISTKNGSVVKMLSGIPASNLNSSGLKLILEDECKGSTINCANQMWGFFPIVRAQQKPQACFAVPLPEKEKKVPCVNCEIGVSVQPLVAATSKMWQTGTTLRVRIDGGSPLVRSKVIQYANVWTSYANIRFNFITSGDAEIIVTFGDDGQSWSMVGRDAIDDGVRFVGNFVNQGTMHFGWLTDETSEEEFSRVITHEFGHALGFKHEQGHPDSNIPWDRERAYAFYGAAPNSWDRGKVDKQVFEVFDRRETQYSNYDRTSIMQYSVSNELTIGDFEIPMNTRLSETDKAFARLMYPPGRIVGNKVTVTVVTGGDDLRVNSQAFIYMKLRSSALPEMKISLNKGAGWGGGHTSIVDIPMPDGVAITDILECKLIFNSGKQFEWDTPDNWNVNRISLEWVTPDNFRNMLATRSGNPFIRFFNTGETTIFLR